MVKFFISFFLCLFFVACTNTATGGSPTGDLKHTSLSYDKNAWNVVFNNIDSLGGSNYGIQFGDQPIIIGFSERPDNTIIMVASVLLQQVEDGQLKQYHKYEKVSTTSSINSLVLPSEWTCSKALVASAEDPENVLYMTNCVYVGSGYWTLLNIVTLTDVTPEEIQQINMAISNVKQVS